MPVKQFNEEQTTEQTMPPLLDINVLMEAMCNALSNYSTSANAEVLFAELLDDILSLTYSEYGVIGRVQYDEHQRPALKAESITNIAWDLETGHMYKKIKSGGMLFSRLDNLVGHIMVSHQTVISNTPSTDPRSGGLPPGHPPLNAFLGLPILSGNQLLGVVGIANRPGGYNDQVVEFLRPFVATCSNIIHVHNSDARIRQIEVELGEFRHHARKQSKKKLGQGYSFCIESSSLFHLGSIVCLTKNERQLLKLLIEHHGDVISSIELESKIWNNRIVSESSLRALVSRLRKKITELDIQSVPGVGYMLRLESLN